MMRCLVRTRLMSFAFFIQFSVFLFHPMNFHWALSVDEDFHETRFVLTAHVVGRFFRQRADFDVSQHYLRSNRCSIRFYGKFLFGQAKHVLPYIRAHRRQATFHRIAHLVISTFFCSGVRCLIRYSWNIFGFQHVYRIVRQVSWLFRRTASVCGEHWTSLSRFRMLFASLQCAVM